MVDVVKAKTGRPRVPLGIRLKAWWEGCDVIVRQRARAAPAVVTPERRVIGYRDPERPWETPRVKLAQMLWGEGFSHPGGTEEAIKLVKPFGLNPAMTVLDLSGGLGGGPRALVEEFGVWVTGLERDREFAEAGAQLSTLAGLAKKADIGVFVPDKLDIRDDSTDCILCREVLHAVPNKARMLRVISQGLKPRGQLLFTDYMLASDASAESAPIKAWLALEPDLELWSLDDHTRLLADQKLDVRVTEDITDGFRRMVIGAWADLTSSTAGASLSPELKECLVSELDRWTRRIAAFDSGDLKVFRVYALKTASSKMLSDW